MKNWYGFFVGFDNVSKFSYNPEFKFELIMKFELVQIEIITIIRIKFS